MKKWTPSWQSRPWKHGLRARHVYALPEKDTDHELLALAAVCRDAMAPYPIDLQSDDGRSQIGCISPVIGFDSSGRRRIAVSMWSA